jgi:hypothetical protein
MHNLDKVDLSGTAITKNGLEKIGKNKKMKSITIIGCPNLTKKDVITFRAKHPGIGIFTQTALDQNALVGNEDIAKDYVERKTGVE